MKTRLFGFFVTLLVFATVAALMSTISGGRHSAISPAFAQNGATARAVTINGSQAGEVLVDDQVVFRIRTSAGGLSPYQRAQIVAQRVNVLMGNSLQSEDVTTGQVNGQDVVLAEGEILITADARHAAINNTSTSALANMWAMRFENAISGRPVSETPTAQKVVPIISVGSGTRIGGALVAGSSNRLDEVVAVAQLEGQFGNSVRVRALIPVSTTNFVQNIRRVPETSVIGLVDIRL